MTVPNSRLPDGTQVGRYQMHGAQWPEGDCAICRKRTIVGLDHIIPYIAGGTNTVENLQWICGPCHAEKTREELRKYGGSRSHREGCTCPAHPNNGPRDPAIAEKIRASWTPERREAQRQRMMGNTYNTKEGERDAATG